VGVNVSREINCRVRLGHCVVHMVTLICYLGLGCYYLRKAPHNLIDLVSNGSHHADIWISFIQLRISSDHPARVSQKIMPLAAF
jgi:hypothetical protein